MVAVVVAKADDLEEVPGTKRAFKSCGQALALRAVRAE